MVLALNATTKHQCSCYADVVRLLIAAEIALKIETNSALKADVVP